MRIIGALWIALGLLGLGALNQTSAESEPLQMTGAVAGPDGVSLDWNDLGPGLAYTVEAQAGLSPGSWEAAPLGIWPTRLNHWTYGVRSPAGNRFFRVVAGPTAATRGKVLSASELRSLSVSDIKQMFAQAGASSLPVGSAVRSYKIIYETINPFGWRTTASGLLLAPESPTNALPLVTYQHGTIVSKDGVPSNMQGLETVIGVAFASGGYLAVLPDYLGLGESPGFHPFLHARSEASAAIDLLRAARSVCATNQWQLNGQLFLVGYSQGGHATMALHRELEASYTNEFTVTASAPMAGPYDMSGVTADDFLSDRKMPNPYYLAYLVAAYEAIYQFADSFAGLLVDPVAKALPPLLDGLHSSSELNLAMGTSQPKLVLKPEFIRDFQNNPEHLLRLALRENSLLDWTPRAPMRLYHCGADQDVLYANSQAAYDSFKRRGATQVELLGGDLQLDHGSCAPFALLAAKLWFDTLVTP